MKTFKELRENFILEKVTHTTLSAVKSILPAGHVHTHEESNDETKVKHNDIIVSRNAKHKEHARFRATSETGGGDITLASYTSREPEHVAIAAHEAHHALIHHKLKGQGALHSNEHIVNKMTRNWIDKNYVGNDRARAHAAVAKSEASYKDHLPGQIVQQHRSERAVKEATYKGKEVSLNKPMAGDVKKRKVYVDPDGDGKAKKVEFGDTTGLTIKTSDPDRRKNFRARHNCDTPGPKDKARYWSCKAWSAPTVKQGLGTENYVVERFSRQELKKYNEIHKNNKLKDLSRKENKLFNDYKHADFQDKSKPHDVENYHPESALLNGFLKHHYDNSYEGTRYSHPDQNPSEKIKAMDDVLKRHKTDREMSVYTGIRSAPKTDENGHAHLPGYTSTSLDPSVANDFASEKSDSDEETHMLHIKLPAGSHAASMHYIGGRDREHEHEHEILMARGYTVKIHPVPKIVEDSFGATKHHIWHATVVKHEPKNLTENYNSKHKKLLTQSHVTIHFGDKEVKIHLDNTNRGMKPADNDTNNDKSSDRKIPMLDTVFGES